MNYFEVLYSDCFGNRLTALVATQHDTPETPTAEYNFNWNGNRLLNYRATDQASYSSNTFRFFGYEVALDQIRKALTALGVKGEPEIQPTDSHQDRWRVTMAGKYVGIYDLHKNTFVD